MNYKLHFAGITGAEENFLHHRNLEPSKNNTKETELNGLSDKQLRDTKTGESIGSKGISTEKATVTSSNKLVLNQQTESEGDNKHQWSQNQQKIFEWGITHYPKGTPERWDKIAEHIPGKTKVWLLLHFFVEICILQLLETLNIYDFLGCHYKIKHCK